MGAEIAAEFTRTVRVALNVVVQYLLGHPDVDTLKREAGQDKMEDEERHVTNSAADAFLLCRTR